MRCLSSRVGERFENRHAELSAEKSNASRWRGIVMKPCVLDDDRKRITIAEDGRLASFELPQARRQLISSAQFSAGPRFPTLYELHEQNVKR